MSRSRRNAGVVRIVCTDPYHRDSDEWTRHGHHWLLNLRQIEGRDRTRLVVPGEAQRTRTVHVTTPDGSIVLFERQEDPQSPVKPYRLVGDERYLIFRFRCRPCGRYPQCREDELLEIAARHRAAFPGQRVEIDIVRLDRRSHVCSR